MAKTPPREAFDEDGRPLAHFYIDGDGVAHELVSPASKGPTPLEEISREDLVARAMLLGVDFRTLHASTETLRNAVARAENRDFEALTKPDAGWKTPEHVEAPEMLDGQYLLFVDFAGRTAATDSSDDEGSTAKDVGERVVPPKNYHAATCVTSAVATDPGELCPDLRTKKHRVILDLDVPARVVPSSTPGHGHLYIDHELTWAQYEELMCVMERVGLLETGYVAASIRRGFTSVRLPWIRKPHEPAPRDVTQPMIYGETEG